MATAKTTTEKTAAKKTASSSSTAKKTTAKKPTAKTSTVKKTTAKKPAASSTKKTTGTSVKVTATEKKLLELYREADSDTKKAAMALLKGEKTQLGGILDEILKNKTVMNTVTSFFK